MTKFKRFFVLCISILFAISLFSGCSSDYEQQLRKRERDLESQITQKQDELNSLKTSINDLKEVVDELTTTRNYLLENDGATVHYVIELKISQTHFGSFDDMLKDTMNTITLPIEVSESFYYSVEKGDTLSNEFRVGSFIMKGSIGSWDITVKDKQIVYSN